MADKELGDALLTKTYTAKVDISTNLFVKIDTTDDTLCDLAGSGEAAVGVVRDTVKTGQRADVILIGRWPVTTSANVTAGDPVAADTGGKARVATTTDQVIGRAVKNANSGDPVMVLLGVGGIF